MTDDRIQERIEWVRHLSGHRNSLVAFRDKLCSGPPADPEGPIDSMGNYQISYDAVRKYHNEGRPPPVHYLVRLHELFDVRVDWLATGHGTPYSATHGEVDTEVVQYFQETRQERLEGMLDELINGTTIPPALQDQAIKSLLVKTVKRKLDIESQVHRILDGTTAVERGEVVQWLNELIAYIMHPSQGLLRSWDLPTAEEMGDDEAWLSAVMGALQGVRERLSANYLRLRTEEAVMMSEAASPATPPPSDNDTWVTGGKEPEPGHEEEV